MLYKVHFNRYIPGPLWNLTSHTDAKERVDLYENSTLKNVKYTNVQLHKGILIQNIT